VLRLSPKAVRYSIGCIFILLVWSTTPESTDYSNYDGDSTQQAVSTTTSMKDQRTERGLLRFDWTNLPVQSPIAKLMVNHQTNCSLPLGNYNWRKKLFGLGSDLHVWGAALCNGVEDGLRLRTHNPWVWLDDENCGAPDESTMSCYFPRAELQCSDDDRTTIQHQQLRQQQPSSNSIALNISNPIRHFCNKTKRSPLSIYNKTDWRAAGIEMLFSSVSPLVQQEAERQLRIVFPPHGVVPKDLITVHMRWNDKKYENKVKNERETLEAVKRIRIARGDNLRHPVSILLCTEDPKAVAAFRWGAPSNFKIYMDQFYHEMLPHQPKDEGVYNKVPKMSRNLHGKTGLWALGSLLVAMEANAYVLVLHSHWSRLMNELRKNVLNPRCNNCTLVEDVAKGKWSEW